MMANYNMEIWCDNDDNNMRKSSKLFSLEPIGTGSSMVESLSGYISRLAVEHRITTGKLFTDVFTPYLDKHYLNEISKRGGNGFFDSACMVNGISITAKQFSSMLNELTGNCNLQDLTLLKFAIIIPQRGLLRTNKAWCPACYEGMAKSKSPVYEPLIWLISTVYTCRKHHSFLAELCSNCQRTNLVMDRRSSPGFCSHCNAWLGKEEVTKTVQLDYEADTNAKMVEDLLKGSRDTNEVGIMNSLKGIVVQENSNITQVARKLSVPKTTFWSWCRGKNLPPITEVIRICNKYGIDIVDFYKGNTNNSHSPVIFSKRKKKMNIILTKRPLFEIKKLAINIVRDASTGDLNVEAMANTVGCNKKTLYNHFPLLCKAQAAKRRQHLNKQKSYRLGNIKYEVTNAIKHELQSGSSPALSRLERYLNKPALFREREIKEHYVETLRKNRPSFYFEKDPIALCSYDNYNRNEMMKIKYDMDCGSKEQMAAIVLSSSQAAQEET